MNIFFVTYWGVSDGLSVSTVYPNLKILSEFEHIKRIVYFTVERKQDENFKDALPPIPKVEHIPIFSKDYKLHLLTKILDWQRIRSVILGKVRKEKPDFLLCRGAMAGIFGLRALDKFGIPFAVESFEPHADYMLESGVWTEGGLKYRFQHKNEQKIKQKSAHLVAVSHNYKKHLEQVDKVSKSRLHVVPCYVQLDKFSFDETKRKEYRKRLNVVDDCKVGLYLGKFGSIYYDEEAFRLFKHSLDYFKGKFHLIILTPTNKSEIEQKLNKVNFPLQKVSIDCVPHEEVPAYLSAADFAFSTVKPADCRKFCSPIKDGEYWAMGLPIIIPDGIGDDSDIIKKEGGGAIIDINDPENIKVALAKIETIIGQANHRHITRKLAEKHRHIDQQKQVYEAIFKKS